MKSRILVVAAALVSIPVIVSAAPVCPPEVAEAMYLLSAKMASAKSPSALPRSQAAARAEEMQAPRQQEQQAPRGQEFQAPREQEQQAPRGQESQAPRGQEQQAPRGQEFQAPREQETQAPRGQEIQAPRNVTRGRADALTNASRLVNEAEAACTDADMSRASANARAAIELLKYLP